MAQSHPTPPSCTHSGHHTPQLHLICVSPIVSLYGATILSQANNVTQTRTAWYRPAQAALSALTAYRTVGASGLGVPGQGETLGPWRAALKQHPTAQRDSIVRRRHVMDDADRPPEWDHGSSIGLVSSRSKHTVRTRLCSGFVQPGCLCAALRPSGRSRLFLRHTYSIVSQRYLILLTLWGVFGYRERVDLTTFTETLRRIMKNSLCQTPNRDATNSSSLGLGRGGLAHQRKHRWKRRGSLGPYPLH